MMRSGYVPSYVLQVLSMLSLILFVSTPVFALQGDITGDVADSWKIRRK